MSHTKTYNRAEAIACMDRLSAEGRNFIFIIDYAGQHAFVQPIDEVDSRECLFCFNAITNVPHEPSHSNIPIEWHVTPPTEADYRMRFDRVKAELLAGNSYLVNLTCKMPVHTNASLHDLFMQSVAPYRLWLKDRMVCFSPESFVKMSHGVIASYPMKGTIDAALPNASELLIRNTKEAAEHATIVDLIRNDLSMVADHVRVSRYRYIDCLQTNKGKLLQTSSEIQGNVLPEYRNRIGSLLFRLLPAGSITGAPKKKTCQIIADAEGYDREFYTGVMGCWHNGVLDSGVMIRFVDKYDGQLFFKAGGGITARSNWQDEYREVIQKAYVASPTIGQQKRTET